MPWVVANSNLALVKYWGKSDLSAKHPAGGSLSVTLHGLNTAAEVIFDSSSREDRVEGIPTAAAKLIGEFMALFRGRFAVQGGARVRVISNFPVAAGLASSASTFAALAAASALAAGLRLDPQEIADLARLGSGSACRSVFGGFVEWRPREEGSVVTQVAPESHWALGVVVAVTAETPKRVSSREGMARTAASSPYYPSWLAAGAIDLDEARRAVLDRNLERLGRVMERNCLRMHAAAMAADPPILYWEPGTVAVMRRVWDLRAQGLEAYLSIDAGPQVKVVCAAVDGDRLAAELSRVPGVVRIIRSRPGGAPLVLDEPPAWVAAKEVAA